MKTLQDEAMTNAVLSGQIEVIEFIKSVTNDIQCPNDDTENAKCSALVDFSEEFPLFNEDVHEIQQNHQNSLVIQYPNLCCVQTKDSILEKLSHFVKTCKR